MRIDEVIIADKAIPLGQFLKLAGLAKGGADAKVMIEFGWVRVNGRVETQHGRQVRPGDLIGAAGREVRAVTEVPDDQAPEHRY